MRNNGYKLTFLFLIAFLIFQSCHIPHTNNDKSKVADNSQSGCKAEDFFLLKENDIQQDFFKNLDSVLLIQYPDGRKKAMFTDITGVMLKTFVQNVDSMRFLKDKLADLLYYDDLAAVQGVGGKLKQSIEISFDESICGFRLLLINYFESAEYADESSVVYSFRILNNRIVDFYRQEVG